MDPGAVGGVCQCKFTGNHGVSGTEGCGSATDSERGNERVEVKGKMKRTDDT